ncbi:hypothetical protein ACGFMK_48075 [Amycolatopsis sp. NPDC049252]|uniref:hypothetical protein n=1 Tax=Amycolatopsis sp. NPDC049252 TaxID=3363933 RepID=UPI0037130615
MSSPGTTTTTNFGADGKPTSSQLVDASPEVQAQNIGGTGSGALGAVLGAANFVYSIIKEHGAKLDLAVEIGGEGVTSGIVDDAKFTVESVGEFSATGIWYTHTRAFGSLLDKHRGKLPHETTTDAPRFSSAYLCTVFPYQVRWSLHKVTPKPISDLEVARKRQEFAKGKTDAYAAFDDRAAKFATEGRPPLETVDPTTKGKITFRPKRAAEDFDEYLGFLRKFDKNTPKLGAAITELETTLAAIEASKVDHEAAVLKSKDTSHPFFIMRNITLRARTEHKGIRQRFWQHLSIKSKFTITPRKEKPYGFSVALVWGETALGYGYPGVAGDFEITQTGPALDDITIRPTGKVGRRFVQFLEKEKLH